MNEYNEQWKDVVGWQGIFQISNFGRVKNIITGNILQGTRDWDGYPEVTLCYKGRRSLQKVHRLLAAAWLGGIERSEDVHHKNHLKHCNCIWNLQKMSHKDHYKLHDTEQRRKLCSEKMMGHEVTEQTRQKLRKANVGKKASEETRKKMSETRKGRPGHPHSEQTKKKLSEAAKKRFKTKK